MESIMPPLSPKLWARDHTKRPVRPTSENLSDETDITCEFFNLIESCDDGNVDVLVRIHLGPQVLITVQVLPAKFEFYEVISIYF